MRAVSLLTMPALVAALAVVPARAARADLPRRDPQPPVARTTPYAVPPQIRSESDTSDPAWADPAVRLPEPGSAEVDVPESGSARAGSLPVSVSAPSSGTAPTRVRVRVLSQAEVSAAGGRLLGVEVTRADGGTGTAYVGITVDYAGVAKAFGGGFASRLRLVRAAGCRGDMPCVQPRVAARNDVAARTLRAATVAVRPEAASGPAPGSGFGAQPSDADSTLLDPLATTYVTTSSASGAAGDFSASSVSPADRWDVGIGSGAFTYSYPVVVPPPVGGIAPSLSFGYSSQAVDGRTVTANGQASKTGEGWSFEPGFIERRFATCGGTANNAAEKCWSSKNEYVLHFGGRGGEIVRDATTGEWRLRGADPAWKVLERTGGPNADNNGEYFVLLTGDGTKHWFGLGAESTVVGATATNSVQEVPVYADSGEPCYNAVASASWCQQAYRWNLDRIVDPNNNVTTFFYGKEYNRYARWRTSALSVQYARSSYLTRVEYAQRAGSESATALARVVVTATDRCYDQTGCTTPTPDSDATQYPDVPLDLLCSASCGTTLDGPTFFSTKKVASVRTEFWNTSTSVYTAVSQYDLSYSFPATNDGSDPSLWLTDVKRTGVYGTGTTELPGLRLGGVRLPNRVTVPAGMPALNKWRVGYVSTDLNARHLVTYGTPHPCPVAPSPSDNGTDCYPQWHDDPDDGVAGAWISFYKYLVTQVVTEDNRGNQPSQTLRYTYNDAPAWHYEDSLLAPAGTQTWSEYRGHGSVDVEVVGDATNEGTTTRHTLFRGMHGDKQPSGSRSVTLADSTGASFHDHDHLAGHTLETQRLTGGGFAFARTRHRYWVQQTVDGPNGFQSHDAQYVRESSRIEETKDLASGAWRDHTVTFEYVGATGVLRKASDNGDPSVSGDGTCTVHGYAYSTDAWIIAAPYRTDTYAGNCSTTSPTKIAETDYYYDGQAFQAAPVKGNVTSVWAYSAASVKAVTNTTYDAYGRVTKVVGPGEVARGTSVGTTTAYTPSTGYPATVTTTLPPASAGAVRMSTVVAPCQAFGTPRTITDANGLVTTVNVDNLGRTTWVSRPGDAAGMPSLRYTYVIGSGTPNRVVTERLRTSGLTSFYVKTFDYLDGLGRVVQQQLPAADSGTSGRRLVVTRYDAAGGAAAVSQPFAATGSPGDDLAVVSTGAIPFETRTEYDYAGRVDRTAQYAAGVSQHAVATDYHGWWYRVRSNVRADVDHHLDVFGRTTSVVERPSSGVTTTTRYGYSRFGDLQQIASVRPSGDVVTTYSYDWLRRRTSSTDPDQGSWVTTYDVDGDVETVRDGNLDTLKYAYDWLRRRTAVSSGTTALAAWTYDTAPRGLGRLASTTRYAGGETYTDAVTAYDDRGRVTGRSWSIPAAAGAVAGTYAFSYTYDPSDALLSVTMPEAGGLPEETVTTAVNGAGLPVSLTSPLGSYVASTSYRNDGRVAERLLAGGVARFYGYDGVSGRLRSLQASAPLAAGGGVPGVVEDLAYTYDDEDNVTSIADGTAGAAGGPQRECFRYDGVNRLTAAFTTGASSCTGATATAYGTDAYDLTYAYDPYGNITSVDDGTATTGYAYPGAGVVHAPATIGSTAYLYDDNGAVTSRTTGSVTETLAWDAEHRLRSFTGAGGVTSFVYDAGGTRLLRTSGGTTTLYLDGMEVSSPSSGTGSVSAVRYYGGAAMRTASGVTVLLRNHQSSTTTAYDVAQQTATHQRYTPFGSRRGSAALAVTERRFLGKTEDPTGLVALGARYYDPAIGRFLSVDPLTDLARPQTLAGYSYALNNPVTFSDPSGLVADRGGPNGGLGCGCSPPLPASDPNPTPTPTPTPTPPPPAVARGGGGGGWTGLLGHAYNAYKWSLKYVGPPGAYSTVVHGEGCFNQDKAPCGWFFLDLAGVGLAFAPVFTGAGAARAATTVGDDAVRAVATTGDDVAAASSAGKEAAKGAQGTALSRLRARMADDTGAIGLPGGSARLTNSQASDLAYWLGYHATKFRSHGQRIFTNGKTFITQDVDAHVGGTWKMANSVDDLLRGNRTGTYDYELNWIAP